MAPEIFVTCLYCNDSYKTYVYTEFEMEELKCRRCQDTSLKIAKKEDTDVFGYNKTEAKPDAYIKKEKK